MYKQFENQALKALLDMNAGHTRSYHLTTFGCQMNAHESEKVEGMLKEAGYIAAENIESADVVLMNTCCVRDHAQQRALGHIGAWRALHEKDPNKIFGVFGCMMQQEGVAEKVLKRFPYLRVVFGTHNISDFPNMLLSAAHGASVCAVSEENGVTEGVPIRRARKPFAYVNIMYGCNNYCSYCIVPSVRGRERSRTSDEIIAEVRSLCGDGYLEIMLLGQNVNSYGQDLCSSMDFAGLLKELDQVEGLERIRFMTSHPKDLSDDVINTVAQSKHICNHIHLPVQSGSDAILKAMNRKYTQAHYLNLLQRLRNGIGGVEITSDIIVGFPGETQKDFEDTLSLVEQADFAGLFTFMYSPRNGTAAADMPGQITEDEKKQRLYALNELQAKKTRNNNEKYLGKAYKILVEGNDERDGVTLAYGKTTNCKTLFAPVPQPVTVGQFLDVYAEKVNKNSIIGSVRDVNGGKA